ncbi:hypothetical protein CCP3SC15_2610003 [Gammaproteobacteria bacterium]
MADKSARRQHIARDDVVAYAITWSRPCFWFLRPESLALNMQHSTDSRIRRGINARVNIVWQRRQRGIKYMRTMPVPYCRISHRTIRHIVTWNRIGVARLNPVR